MGIIYLVNILHKFLIYSKYTLISVTIMLRPFMLIIILDYTCNMVVHVHSYIYIYILILLVIYLLYIHRVATKLVTFAINGT